MPPRQQRRLAQLLEESRATAASRIAACRLAPGGRVALFGAGSLGRRVRAAVRAGGVECAAFLDDTPQKQGTTIDGVPVIDPASAAQLPGTPVIAVTMLNPEARFVDIRRRLHAAGCHRVFSLAQLSYAIPAVGVCSGWTPPDQLLSDDDAIARALELFADDQSRDEYIAQVAFRLQANYDALPAAAPDAYFPAGVPIALDAGTIFVDGGAFDGDTIRQFLAASRSAFRAIVAFEPDSTTFERLERFVEKLPERIRGRVRIVNAALGERAGSAGFRQTASMSSALDADAATTVPVAAIDDAGLPPDSRVYLKLDVEGAEEAALAGARNVLARRSTAFAVSIYHRPADLWNIPRQLHAMAPGRRLYVRTHGTDGTDVVCYGVAA